MVSRAYLLAKQRQFSLLQSGIVVALMFISAVCEIQRLEDFPSEIKIRRRTKYQSKQQHIILKLPNITSTRLAIIRKQRNTMRPAITRKRRTMLMSHTDTIYRQFITTRRQQDSISSITARSRPALRKSYHQLAKNGALQACPLTRLPDYNTRIFKKGRAA